MSLALTYCRTQQGPVATARLRELISYNSYEIEKICRHWKLPTLGGKPAQIERLLEAFRDETACAARLAQLSPMEQFVVRLGSSNHGILDTGLTEFLLAEKGWVDPASDRRSPATSSPWGELSREGWLWSLQGGMRYGWDSLNYVAARLPARPHLLSTLRFEGAEPALTRMTQPALPIQWMMVQVLRLVRIIQRADGLRLKNDGEFHSAATRILVQSELPTPQPLHIVFPSQLFLSTAIGARWLVQTTSVRAADSFDAQWNEPAWEMVARDLLTSGISSTSWLEGVGAVPWHDPGFLASWRRALVWTLECASLDHDGWLRVDDIVRHVLDRLPDRQIRNWYVNAVQWDVPGIEAPSARALRLGEKLRSPPVYDLLSRMVVLGFPLFGLADIGHGSDGELLCRATPLLRAFGRGQAPEAPAPGAAIVSPTGEVTLELRHADAQALAVLTRVGELTSLSEHAVTFKLTEKSIQRAMTEVGTTMDLAAALQAISRTPLPRTVQSWIGSVASRSDQITVRRNQSFQVTIVDGEPVIEEAFDPRNPAKAKAPTGPLNARIGPSGLIIMPPDTHVLTQARLRRIVSPTDNPNEFRLSRARIQQTIKDGIQAERIRGWFTMHVENGFEWAGLLDLMISNTAGTPQQGVVFRLPARMQRRAVPPALQSWLLLHEVARDTNVLFIPAEKVPEFERTLRSLGLLESP
jgi:hypothetical protein